MKKRKSNLVNFVIARELFKKRIIIQSPAPFSITKNISVYFNGKYCSQNVNIYKDDDFGVDLRIMSYIDGQCYTPFWGSSLWYHELSMLGYNVMKNNRKILLGILNEYQMTHYDMPVVSVVKNYKSLYTNRL